MNCPTSEELASYLVGKLGSKRSEELDEHFAACEPCQATIQTVAAQSDTLFPQLRDSVKSAQPGEPNFLDEPQLQFLMEQIRQLAEEALGVTLAESGTPHADGLPERIGPYQLLSKLGEGGMGTVYLARHTRLDRLVALKLLPPQRMRSSITVARFEREMKAVGKLDHPNIVRATDADEDRGRHYLVMEYVEGTDLSELVRQSGPLPIPAACAAVQQAAVGLQHAHEHGMVHRDIKPSNLMLTPRGEIKILDLGLALLGDVETSDGERDDSSLTDSGQPMGTLDYMAPEQCDDSHTVDIRADIYSLGATLYKLLTGEVVFSGPQYQTSLQKLRAIALETAPPITERRADIPDSLAAIVHRMIAREPSARFATPAEVAAALAPFAEGAELAGLIDTDHASHAADDTSDAVKVYPSVSEAKLSLQSHRPWLRSKPALWSLVLVPLLLAAMVYTMRTRQGLMQFEIEDPNIQVVLDKDGAVVRGVDGKREIKVSPGEHGLTITYDNLSFETDKFVLKRGELTRLKVTLLTDEVQVLRDGRVIGREPLKPRQPPTPRPAENAAQPEMPDVLTPAQVFEHKNSVTRLLFTPDSSRLITASNGDHHIIRGRTRYHVTGTDNAVRVWSLETGNAIRHFGMPEGHHYGPQGIAVSPDGTKLGISSSWIWANGPPEPRVYVWEIGSSQRLHHFQPPDNHAIRDVVFSADGNTVLASRSGSGGINRWSLDTEQELENVQLADHAEGEASRMTFSPDGRYLLSGWGGAAITVWDTTTGQVFQKFTGHTRPTNHAVFSPDGKRVLSCAGDYSIRLWDLESGEQLRRIGDLDSAVNCVAFTPDGRHFLAGAEDGSLTVYETATGNLLARRAGHEGKVLDVACSPAGNLAASGGADNTAHVWKLDLP